MLAVLLLYPATAISCFSYTCTELDYMICATKVSDYDILVNFLGCDGFCSAEGVISWAPFAELREEYSCLSREEGSLYEYQNYYDQSSKSKFDQIMLRCPERDQQKDLAEGHHPKLCYSELDCELEDGTYSQCACGLSSQAFCVPDLSSKEYDSYWAECKDGRYSNPEAYEHWMNLVDHYTLTVEPPICTWQLFDELEFLQNYMESSGMLVLFPIAMGLVIAS